MKFTLLAIVVAMTSLTACTTTSHSEKCTHQHCDGKTACPPAKCTMKAGCHKM